MKETSKEKKRNLLIDILKGETIVLVVLGHSIQTLDQNFDSNLIFKIIYSFHMPLFMFLSGYVAFLSVRNKPLLQNVKRKVLSLAMPFLSWALIGGYFFAGLFHSVTLYSFTRTTFKFPDTQLWFIWILFLNFLILFLVLEIEKIFKISSKYFDFLSLVLITIFLALIPYRYFGVQLVTTYFPYFYIGYLVSKYKDTVKKYFSLLTEISLVGYPILFLYWNRVTYSSVVNKISTILQTNKYASILDMGYKFVVAMFGIVIVFAITKSIKNSLFQKLMIFLSNYTLDIYSIQEYVFFIFFVKFFSEGNILSIPMTTLIVLLLSLFITIFIIRKSRILRFIFYGQTRD